MRIASKWVALFVLGFASQALATNYSLWIHGRGGSAANPGDYGNFSAFGPSSANAGVNKRAVNWDGRSRIADQNALVRDALDCFCTGGNWCYVAVHSAGDLQIGYALALYGTSERTVRDASPAANGVCGATDGSTQSGWNIKFVDVAAGAAGGSELADMGNWAVGEPLVKDLVTTTARALYNHNQTQGITFNMFTGSKGTLYSFLLPGQDDEVVAYHSSGGVAGSSGGAYCNPSDWFCNDLTLGTQACEGNHPKWANHSVSFRDNYGSFSHGTNASWGGVVSKARADMQTNAF